MAFWRNKKYSMWDYDTEKATLDESLSGKSNS